MDHKQHSHPHQSQGGRIKLDKNLETMFKYGFAVIAVLLLINVYGSFKINTNLTHAFEAVLAQGGGGAPSAPSAPTQAAPRPAAPAQAADVNTEGAFFEGPDPSDAKVVIVEYSDFQCPFCGRFFSQTLPGLKQKYIEGRDDVSFVYKHFPLSFHPEAQGSGEASECAGEQGKFWEFHDLLFQNQQALSTAGYKQWAGQLGLNQGQFDQCLDSGKYRNKVQEHFREGQTDGVSGTPTVFVNGRRIVGAQPLNVFEQAIEAELAK